MKLNKYTSLILAGLLLFSCQEDESPAVSAGGQEVSLNLSVEALEMKQAGGAVPTRSVSPAIDMTFGADAATRADKDANEKMIKALYLVQFNGTAATSTVVKSGTIARDVNDNTTVFDFSAVNATCRVYVVANFNPNATNGTTLDTFEKSMATYAARTTVDVNAGIPMCASQDFNPTTVSSAPKFAMTAMVAKLIVTYTVDPAALADYKPGTTVNSLDIVLKSVPNGTAYKPTTTPAVAYRPTNVTFADIPVGKTGATYTYYVPENIAGNSKAGISDWKKRSLKNASADALYFEITGRHKEDKGTIIVASFIGDPAKPNEFNIYRNYAYTLTATIKNANTLDERVTVKPDYFNLNEELGNKSANCYVITDNTSKDYGFDATIRGNNATGVAGINYDALPKLTTATEARIIWQTGSASSVIKTVRLEDSKVIFTTGTATEGNAVIGLFASNVVNAECLWSWHIWKVNGALPTDVNCTKTPSPSTASPTFKMMALNLGAFNNTPGNVGSIGLLYQWGRKDPFPGPNGFSTAEPSIFGSFNNGGTTGIWNGAYSIKTSTTNATIGTEAWAAKYPTAYIINGSSPYDWYWGGTRNDNLWGTPWVASGSVGGYNGSQGVKSIYDPCPVGYRVPPQDTWSKQTGNGSFANNGITLNSVASGFWFPAAGYRGGSTGVLVNARVGYFWSSSPYADGLVSAGSLYFDYNGAVNPRSSYYRAYGYSVRCVSE